MRNAVPVLGLVLLGWSAKHMLLLYYVDSLVSFAGLFVLVGTDLAPPDSWPPGTPQKRLTRDEVGDLFGAGIFMVGLFAAVTCVPLLMAFRSFNELLEPQILVAVAIQLATAVAGLLATRRSMRGKDNDAGQDVLIRRAAYVTGRWVFAAFLVGTFVPYAWAVVVAYAAASVWLELRPPPQARSARTILPPD